MKRAPAEALLTMRFVTLTPNWLVELAVAAMHQTSCALLLLHATQLQAFTALAWLIARKGSSVRQECTVQEEMLMRFLAHQTRTVRQDRANHSHAKVVASIALNTQFGINRQ